MSSDESAGEVQNVMTSEVHPLPRISCVQLVTVDRGLGTVDIQYLDADGDAHELTMSLIEGKRLLDALAPLSAEP